MNELEQRVKALENKVKVLEETLSTLKNMQLSDQMNNYLDSKTKTLKMMSLLNTVSDEEDDTVFDIKEEKEKVATVVAEKAKVDEQIYSSVKYIGSFSDDMPDDPRYFEYEIESGTITNPSYTSFSSTEEQIEGLADFARKGLRITAYNGFDSDRVVVPKEIDGMPVISIGVDAFKNASFSEIILPSTLKAILKSAFNGCRNLRNIDLPNGLRFLGEYCFSNSGLNVVRFPNSICKIERGCCSGCEELERVEFGLNIAQIDEYAFARCYNLKKMQLPEKLVEIHSGAFAKTALNTLVLPESVIAVSTKVFIDITNNNNNSRVNVAVMGKTTSFGDRKDVESSTEYDSFFQENKQKLEALMFRKTVGTIYCLPGSEAQQFARINNIPMKPLSELRKEDYQ